MSAIGKTPVAVTLALIAGLAWLASREMDRSRSHALDQATLGNLRQLATGADQYFLAHSVSSVALAELIGRNSSQYVRTFQTVANETYPTVLVRGQPITASGIAGARTVTYGN